MNDHYLDAANRAFTAAFREFMLKWHPELDTALNRDTAAYAFRSYLAKFTSPLEPLPKSDVDQQLDAARQTLVKFKEAWRRFRFHRNGEVFGRDIDDCIADLQKKTFF